MRRSATNYGVAQRCSYRRLWRRQETLTDSPVVLRSGPPENRRARMPYSPTFHNSITVALEFASCFQTYDFSTANRESRRTLPVLRRSVISGRTRSYRMRISHEDVPLMKWELKLSYGSEREPLLNRKYGSGSDFAAGDFCSRCKDSASSPSI